MFFIGRGIDYAISMEGSLKLKEISYIHSEAYAAGELKHGTISLIEDGTLVIGVLTQGDLYEKTLSNLLECRSRGAYLMGLTAYGNYNIEDTADFTVYVPKLIRCLWLRWRLCRCNCWHTMWQWGGDWMSTSRAIWPKALR